MAAAAAAALAPCAGEERRSVLSLLRQAQCRYESLNISDDVFGESGDDATDGGDSSAGNPFYSSSDSSSDHGGGGGATVVAAAVTAGGAEEGEAGEAAEDAGLFFRNPLAEESEERGGDAGEREAEEYGEDGWSSCLRDAAPFPDFTGSCGPTLQMPASATPADFFQLFVPDGLLKIMVSQTNAYARKFQERFGQDPAWHEVDVAEMRAFLGVVASTATHHCESVLSIWGGGFYGNRSVAVAMTRVRFEKLLKYFHVVAFRSAREDLPGLYKVQPFLDSLKSSFEASFMPSQTQVLHEPLIEEDPTFLAACTSGGCASEGGERRRRKKRKFGLWVRQCSQTGFICQIHVHLKESSGSGSDCLDAFRSKSQLHGLVARRLCHSLPPSGYVIFCGPSITSLPLFQEFQEKGIHCCGLLSPRKSDCTGLPRMALTGPKHPLARGQHSALIKGGTSLLCWSNKSLFRFLTNAYSPLKQGAIIKRKGGHLMEVACPQAVEAFAAHLGYICKYDDKYSRYFISHKPNKTWQQVFWLALSIAINNAYILYKLSPAYQAQRYSRAQFGERLVQQLLRLPEANGPATASPGTDDAPGSTAAP
ncbi:piggyBac transposable element-derived protein 5 isoform X2 [Lampetra fluviatilis]